MYKSALAFLLIFGCLSFVQAQDEYHKFEVYGGYSRDISKNPNLSIDGAFNERESGNGEEKSFNGFNASATYNFSKHLGIKIDIADHFSTGSIFPFTIGGTGGGDTKKSRLTIQSGLQIKNNSKEARFKPFGHVLAGIHRQSVKIVNPSDRQSTNTIFGSDKITSTGFAATAGGGLDIRIGKRFDIRVAQFNYTVNFVSDKPLGRINFFGSNVTTAIESQRQNQFTFGFGVVFH